MADVTNNTLNAYFKNRVKYHAASRLASQTGEGLSQALNVDGHIITYNKVWTAPVTQFPNNADKANVDPTDATNDLVNVFKTQTYASIEAGTLFDTDTKYFQLIDGEYVESAVTAGEAATDGYYIMDCEISSETFWNTGTVWSNSKYPAVKLYENVPMTPVKGSDGNGVFQSFEVLAATDGVSSGTIRLADWVAPTAVADQSTGKPVAGFSGIAKYGSTLAAAKALQAANTTKWAASLGTWEFVYMAGLLQFEPGYTPQNINSNAVNVATGKTYLYLTAFKYDGDYLSDTLDDNAASISVINQKIDELEVTASVKELASGTATIYANEVIGSTTGISGTVENGLVTVQIAGEVILTKQNNVEISPDMSYVDGITTLTADYGTITNTIVWQITYRV